MHEPRTLTIGEAVTAMRAGNLTFGIQIAAQAYAEERLLDVAAWCERALAFSAAPPDVIHG